MTNAPYLNDKLFLRQLDLENHKTHFIRITILDFQTEADLASIEGKATGGAVNLSGTSSMRRNASCSLVVDPKGIKRQGYTEPQQYYNITNIENLISLNKKIRLEIGLFNSLQHLGDNYYPQYNIIWFPLGVYVIKSANVSKNNSGINISLTLSDKSALLNGDVGGVFPAAIVFSESESFDVAGTSRQVDKILIKDIIKQIVSNFGGEKIENIIIEDIPDTIVKVMKWSGTEPVYLNAQDGNKSLSFERPSVGDEGQDWFEFQYGQNIGYIPEPFVYPGTLECKAGETIASVLDKIKNALGNYEWFFDVNGKFHFQEIKNYLNKTVTKSIFELSEIDYLSLANFSTSVYSFDENNKHLIASITSNPQYHNIKNDYIVWGISKTGKGNNKPIRYHLAFDKKPEITDNYRFGLVYKNYLGLEQFTPLFLEGEKKNVMALDAVEGEMDPNYYYAKRVWKESEIENE